MSAKLAGLPSLRNRVAELVWTVTGPDLVMSTKLVPLMLLTMPSRSTPSSASGVLVGVGVRVGSGVVAVVVVVAVAVAVRVRSSASSSSMGTREGEHRAVSLARAFDLDPAAGPDVAELSAA